MLHSVWSISALFEGTGAGTFTVLAASPKRDACYAGLGVNAQVRDNVTAFLQYDTELFKNNFSLNNINAGARIAF